MTQILSHAPGGGYNPLDPQHRPIDMAYVGDKLARIIRYNGEPGAISVAQHAVLGAEAILNEGGEAFDAALFLHSSDYKFILGDMPRQVDAALTMLAPDYGFAWPTLERKWNTAIFATLRLPPPNSWTMKQAAMVTRMEMRMQAVETRVLFGISAVAGLSSTARRTPEFDDRKGKNSDPLKTWEPEIAAEAWKAMHGKLTGRTIR